MSFKEVWSQTQMKKGLACLAYSQKYIRKQKKKKLEFFNCVLLLAGT